MHKSGRKWGWICGVVGDLNTHMSMFRRSSLLFHLLHQLSPLIRNTDSVLQTVKRFDFLFWFWLEPIHRHRWRCRRRRRRQFRFSFFDSKFMLSISRLISTSLRTTTMCFTPFLRFAFALGVSPFSIVWVCVCAENTITYSFALTNTHTRTRIAIAKRTNRKECSARPC